MATTVTTATPASEFLGKPKRMLIDGEWIAAQQGRTLEVYDPAPGEVIESRPRRRREMGKR